MIKNIIEENYHDFTFNGEFPNLYMVLLYESGGDFVTYAKILGYENIELFYKHYDEFNEVYKDRFLPFDINTYGQ